MSYQPAEGNHLQKECYLIPHVVGNFICSRIFGSEINY